MAIATAVTVTLGAIGSRTLVSVAVSLILSWVAWRALGKMRQAWTIPDWLAAARLPGHGHTPESSPAVRRWPRRVLSRPGWLPSRARIETLAALCYSRLQPELVGGVPVSKLGLVGRVSRSDGSPAAAPTLEVDQSGRQGFFRAALPVAVAASAAWLVWRKPGPWEDVLVVGLGVVFAIRKLRTLERGGILPELDVLVGPALHFARRAAVVGFVESQWRALPNAARTTLPPLVLLNLLIGVEFGSTKLFVLMAATDLVLLHRLTRTSSPIADGVAGAPDPAQPNPLRSAPPAGPGRDHDALTPTRGERGGTAPQAPVSDSPAGPGSPVPPVSPPGRRTGLAAKLQPPLAFAALVIAIAWIAYAHPGPALIPAVLVIGLTIPFTAGIDRDRAITMVLAIAVTAAAIDYVSWRLVVTNWQGWWIAAPLLLAETFGAIHLLGFQLTIWPWPQPQIELREDAARHPVFIFVPALREGAGVLRPTLEGCISARERYLQQHPRAEVTIVVCNDGRAADAPGWQDIDALALELGVASVTRATLDGAKAGNIENARQAMGATGDALLVIFDADQVPRPEFLLKTVPPFGDPAIAWVQTGQYYANLGNPVSRWADDQQSMFYNLLCPGKAAMNAAFICGTNVVIRTAALDEIGGLPQDSVTEDFAASIALHPRWRSIYLTDVLATGLGPLDVPSYFKQQARWALGTLGVFRSNWRDILLPRRNGLRIGQRAQYFLACTHYLCGLRDLVYLISPMLFIATGIPAVRSASLTQYLLHFVPYAFLGLLAMWYAARGVTGPRGIIIGFGSFPALLGSLLAVLLKRKASFVTTSKKHAGEVSLRHLRVHIALVFLCLGCLVWATQVTGQQATSLFISVLWVVYSLGLLGSFLWLAVADAGLGAATKTWGATDEVAAKLPYPSKLRRPIDRVKPAWNVGLAVMAASPLVIGPHLTSLPLFSHKSPTPFVISQEKPGAPYLGLSVPTQLLWTRPALLERDLGTQFSIIGRTQGMQDRFDTSWADYLAAHHARPWITLEFGVFGADHKPPLSASLPAILNGLADAAIARWANEIRDFGKPVYLTILRHVDKNWSLSSGVANGGIPQDVPKVWEHVQSIFRVAGATNVVWVWAPADPAHDQAFAPPPATIGVVLQSFINYPETRWGDPSTVLRKLIQRYPGKPLFVEASVAGPASERAAWLDKLKLALPASRRLYALLYHEGGPDLTVTPSQLNSWSFAADPLSLNAMKGVVSSLRMIRRFQ